MIEDRLRALLEAEVGIGIERVGALTGLFPDEQPAVAKAIPKRQAEFAAGRRAARVALAQIGVPACAIPVGDSRAPIWPDGVRGAITHHGEMAIAIASRGEISGLGIDLTDRVPLPEGTDARIIPHADEGHLGPIDARLAFAAKEAFFKAAFPSVGGYFDFSAVIFAPSDQTFTLTQSCVLGPWPEGTCHTGHWFAADNNLIAVLIIP